MLKLNQQSSFDHTEYELCSGSLVLVSRSSGLLYAIPSGNQPLTSLNIKCTELLRSVEIRQGSHVALLLATSIQIYLINGTLLQIISISSNLLGCEFIFRDLVVISTRGIHLFSVSFFFSLIRCRFQPLMESLPFERLFRSY
jgi:hypothetical protein